MAEWPDNAQGWPERPRFGIADWDTGVLADAQVVDAEGGSVHSADADAAAAVAGDPAAAVRLGVAGVVAVRSNWVVFEAGRPSTAGSSRPTRAPPTWGAWP
jgi:hypothetical protein